MGMRGHVTGDSTLEDVRVDSDALLGNVGEGFRSAMGAIDRARTGLGAIGTGIAQSAYDEAVDYASERRQGGSAIGE
jgi:butyryl-CoA dehydrogenase